jgi:hypothetical protein
MTVALLALFVALGGTATAARIMITSTKQLRDGVVHYVDLAPNAVDSQRVRNGSLGVKDLNAGVRSSLSQAGTQVLEAFRPGGPKDNPAGEEKAVATLAHIPPGAYALFAKSTIAAASDTDILGLGEALSAKCSLEVSGDADVARSGIGAPDANTPATLNMQITRTFGSAGSAQVVCSSNATWAAANTSIIALRVSAPSRQEVDG